MNRWLLYTVCLLVFFSHQAHPENINLITLDVKPWASYDEDAKRFVGVFPDFIREVERRTGYGIDISLSPFLFERVNRELDMGRQDCKVFILDEKRESIIVVGDSVFDLPMGVVPKKELKLVDRKSLKGVKISTLKPLAKNGKFMDDESLYRVFDSSYSVGLKKLARGRVDAVAGAIPTIMFLAKNKGIGDAVGEPLIFNYEKIYFQCSKDSKKINDIENISKVIEQMRAEGVLVKISNENHWRK